MKSKTTSPHRFALYLGAAILGYFVCGFVAQRVLAEEAPRRPEYLIIYDLGPLPTLKAEPRNIKIVSGYAIKLMVGDAVLTKKSVGALIETLTKYRDNVIPALRASYTESVAQAVKTKGGSEYSSAYAMLTKLMDEDLSGTTKKLNGQIAELQKLADALAEEAK